jgi:hypothetical protein
MIFWYFTPSQVEVMCRCVLHSREVLKKIEIQKHTNTIRWFLNIGRSFLCLSGGAHCPR